MDNKNLQTLTILIPISLFEAWGYKLIEGQRMVCIDNYPCVFKSKVSGKFIRYPEEPVDEANPEIAVNFYTVKFTSDGLYKKGKVFQCFDTELKVVFPVLPKCQPENNRPLI